MIWYKMEEIEYVRLKCVFNIGKKKNSINERTCAFLNNHIYLVRNKIKIETVTELIVLSFRIFPISVSLYPQPSLNRSSG